MIDDYSRPAAPAVKPACETCRFWGEQKLDVPHVISVCRRRAPHASVRWPLALADDWCGEYEVKQPIQD